MPASGLGTVFPRETTSTGKSGKPASCKLRTKSLTQNSLPLSCGPRQFAGEQPDVGDDDPGSGASDSSLEILGKPATAAKPSESPLDHPSAGKHSEAFDVVRAPDDLEVPGAETRQRLAQMLSRIGAVGKEVEQIGILFADHPKQIDSTIAVLDARRVDMQSDEMALCVGDDVTLASVDLLGCVEARAMGESG